MTDHMGNINIALCKNPTFKIFGHSRFCQHRAASLCETILDIAVSNYGFVFYNLQQCFFSFLGGWWNRFVANQFMSNFYFMYCSSQSSLDKINL